MDFKVQFSIDWLGFNTIFSSISAISCHSFGVGVG